MSIEIARNTKETQIKLSLNIDGNQNVNINTGIPFFDHMLEQLAVHARWDLDLQVAGDLQVDDHHTVEDVALTLGEALQESWRGRPSMQRYGQRLLPMDETLIMCAVDVSGRPICRTNFAFSREFTGGVSTEMWPHFFLSLAMAAKMTLHIKVEYFENNHHLIEGSFKALAYALKEALTPREDTCTTKGKL
ncbi:MAG: imidazoleglycerol-phosphate dehydratase HisB [Pseudomonadota bacterium]